MNIPQEKDVQTQRIPDVLISLLYESEESVSIRAALWENMRNYKHQFIANGKKHETLQFCSHKTTSTHILISQRRQNSCNAALDLWPLWGCVFSISWVKNTQAELRLQTWSTCWDEVAPLKSFPLKHFMHYIFRLNTDQSILWPLIHHLKQQYYFINIILIFLIRLLYLFIFLF